MRTSWLVVVCSFVSLTLAACASGPTAGPGPHYASAPQHGRETTRLASTLTRASTVAVAPVEPLRLVTDHERRVHK
jgi:hypothetical protein